MLGVDVVVMVMINQLHNYYGFEWCNWFHYVKLIISKGVGYDYNVNNIDDGADDKYGVNDVDNVDDEYDVGNDHYNYDENKGSYFVLRIII